MSKGLNASEYGSLNGGSLKVSAQEVLRLIKGTMFGRAVRSSNQFNRIDLALREAVLALAGRRPQLRRIEVSVVELANGQARFASPDGDGEIVKGQVVFRRVYYRARRRPTKGYEYWGVRNVGDLKLATVANCRKVGVNIP